ncbi:DNA-binding protein [uncultured Corynebacterium sp.]|uniref:DNA-binding protein n=1 Tax=uncultured Corynebacterium sp. TaxID=159447 RepID=UPI0025EFF893|nr:DNA-binding protein [uncultured Corynebacterium sp.]
MFAVHARYRGRSTRRADHVRASATALSRLDGVGTVVAAGVEELSARPRDAVGVTTLALALLAAGDWAIGIGVSPSGDGDAAAVAAAGVLGKGGRAGTVRARIRTGDPGGKELSDDIAAAFTLLHHVISRRSPEGREATNLVRAGWTQVEAAAELGVSKQAINQRLQAAGWHAEEAGWSLAVHLLQRAAKE